VLASIIHVDPVGIYEEVERGAENKRSCAVVFAWVKVSGDRVAVVSAVASVASVGVGGVFTECRASVGGRVTVA